MSRCVPQNGDEFFYTYRNHRTKFRVLRKDKENLYLCLALDGPFNGLKALFEESQVLILIGIRLHAGACR